MYMFRITLFLLLVCFVATSHAQSTLMRVTFPVDEQQTLRDLARAGLDLTHGHGSTREAFTTEVQNFQLPYFDELGIRYVIDIPDLSVYRNSAPHEHHEHHGHRGSLLDCQKRSFDETVPRNFEMGSIGGFFSMSEVLDHLDAMQILYPQLISIRKPIGNFKTWQNNSIFYVKISDNPEVNENEPQVLYTSLHHAREFVSVSQTIYFMWYLLENYEKSPLVRQILDHTELFFVPVVNPDGLNYNAGGYIASQDQFTRNHRKNMRDNNGNGTFEPEVDGVDLNRNYGLAWGHDNEGSSGFHGSDTYRGPSPFSEPETRAIEYLCSQHDFKLALNYHSYGNLLVHPWGFDDSDTQDSVAFSNYGALLTQLNRFVYGRGSETVGYVTNGDSDDWMYGEMGILAMTPEVGDPDDGFYPRRERIIPLCQSTLELNLLAARLVNSLVRITDETPRFIQPGINTLELGFSRYGLIEGEVTVSFNSLSPYVVDVPSPIQMNLQTFQPHDRTLSYTVDPFIPIGTSVKIEVVCQQGQYSFRDTLTKIRADFNTVVADDGDLSNWDTSKGQQWGTTTTYFKSGPVSITDSPNGPYAPNASEAILLEQSIDLRHITSAYVQFWAKWDIEDFYDYVVFQASKDGKNWVNLCGDYSRPGSLFQLYDQPLYDSRQLQWVLENVDLSDFLGEIIELRFLLVTDGFVHKDGFYFDNFRVITIDEGSVSTDDIKPTGFNVFPNPAGDRVTFSLPDLTRPAVAVFNVMGQLVYSTDIQSGSALQVRTSGWPEGLYYYQIYAEAVPIHSGTISIIR